MLVSFPPCFDKNNQPYIHNEPDYLYNSFSRFNVDFSHFWHIDKFSETIKDLSLIRTMMGNYETDQIVSNSKWILD